MRKGPISIYHFTHISNLQSILEAGGLQSPKTLREVGISYVDIAYSTVQGRRASKRVPCGPRGVIHDYVPFYFAPHSPMLFTIAKGNVQSYKEGQEPLIYLVSTVQAIDEAGLPFVFTDGHGIIEYTNFYDDLAQLSQVDWPLMHRTYWANTSEDSDRVRRRQAEFLVHDSCPWGLITEIGVIDRATKVRVAGLIKDLRHKPPIVVRRNWYF